MEKAEYGDIIYTNHKLYRHYGIYLSEDCVIHYDGKIDDKWLRHMCIRKTNMQRFLAGVDRYYIYSGKVKYTPEETVQRAESKIGERAFDLVKHNCEHFTMWCKTGQTKSSQANLVELAILFLCLYELKL